MAALCSEPRAGWGITPLACANTHSLRDVTSALLESVLSPDKPRMTCSHVRLRRRP